MSSKYARWVCLDEHSSSRLLVFISCAKKPRLVIHSTLVDPVSSTESSKVGPREGKAPDTGFHCPVFPLMFLDLVGKLV